MVPIVARGRSLLRWATVVACTLSFGCSDDDPKTSSVSRLEEGDITNGGMIYDKWWTVAGVAAPSTDHPLWSSRPDVQSNGRMGADTWRCKECHGWDYIGVLGRYSSGDHRTGFPGILGTQMSALDIFGLIKNDQATTLNGHGYGAAGLDDGQIWDVVRFVLEGTTDTTAFIAQDGSFIGDTSAGETIYNSGVGNGDPGCTVCHGADGLQQPAGGAPDFDEFPGVLASDNPQEFQHKLRFGQPGTAMPGMTKFGGSVANAADVAAYSATLPMQ